jgi:hypothetical protein
VATAVLQRLQFYLTRSSTRDVRVLKSQHIWNSLTGEVTKNERSPDISCSLEFDIVSEDRSIGSSICRAERTANMNHLELEPMIIGRNFKKA